MAEENVAIEDAEVVSLPQQAPAPQVEDEQVKQCIALMKDILERYDCFLEAEMLVTSKGIIPFFKVSRRQNDARSNGSANADQ